MNSYTFLQLYYELFANITKTTIATLIITLTCVVILWCFKEYIAPRLKKLTRLPIPIDLIVVSIRMHAHTHTHTHIPTHIHPHTHAPH